jgi:hypothetical protein
LWYSHNIHRYSPSIPTCKKARKEDSEHKNMKNIFNKSDDKNASILRAATKSPHACKGQISPMMDQLIMGKFPNNTWLQSVVPWISLFHWVGWWTLLMNLFSKLEVSTLFTILSIKNKIQFCNPRKMHLWRQYNLISTLSTY